MRPSIKIAIILLLLLWVLPGTVGRDPWKADEPYSISMAVGIMHTGDWVVPRVAGVPFLEKPPLYYLSAALAGTVFSKYLAVHDAVRLVNLFWMAVTFLALGLAAREIGGERPAWTAPVLLAGSLLLQMPGHKLITDVGLLSGFALGFYGFAISLRKPAAGGFLIGIGAGVGFLTKGLLAPGVFGMTALLLPLFFPEWRRREYGRALLLSFAAALPFLIIWPLALYLRAPGDFVEWFWYQNFGRFLGFARIGAPDSHWDYLLKLPVIALPVFPVALWAFWTNRRERSGHPAWQLALTFFLVTLTVLSLASSSREIYALPLLLPLCAVAAVGADAVPERMAGRIHALAVVLFGMLGLALWAAAFLAAGGHTALAAALPHKTVHYAPIDDRLLFGALVFTAAWLASVLLVPRREAPLLFSWTSGVMLVWGLAMTLLLPWFEAEASYRDAFTPLKEPAAVNRSCVASIGLGESERAMLEYYAGIEAVPVGGQNEAPCDLLLLGEGMPAPDRRLDGTWKVLWSGMRPAERAKERYTLYQRATTRSAMASSSGDNHRE